MKRTRLGTVIAVVRKGFALAGPQDRWKWAAMVPLAGAAALLEAVSAAAVFFLIGVFEGSRALSPTSRSGHLLRAFLAAHRGRSGVALAAVILVGFFILKNILLSFLSAWRTRVQTESSARLGTRLFRIYLHAPFALHLARNSSELIRTVMDSTDLVFRLVMAEAVGAVSEGLIVAALVGVLLMAAPLVTLVCAGVLLTLLWVVLKFSRRALSRWSRQQEKFRKESYQTLQQGLGAIKDIRVAGRENYFEESFQTRVLALFRTRYRFAALVDVTRLALEALFVCGLLLVVLMLSLQPSHIAAAVPVLGLFAYAGFRIIPSVNRILRSVQSIRFGSAAVDIVYTDVVNIPAPATMLPPADGHAMTLHRGLAVEGVTFSYPGRTTKAVDGVTFHVARGEAVGIVGPTGAGKSTTLDLLLALLKPDSGEIRADGEDIFSNPRAWQRRIGYVPQAVFLMDDTLCRNIAFGLPDSEIDEDRLREVVRLAQLDEFVGALPQGLATIVGERGVRLSGGERQRVAIARALYQRPELLLFDEATSALDPRTEREVTAAIEALAGRTTMIIIAHRLSTVRRCDRIIFLQHGLVAGEGSFDELAAANAGFRAFAALSEPPAAENLQRLAESRP